VRHLERIFAEYFPKDCGTGLNRVLGFTADSKLAITVFEEVDQYEAIDKPPIGCFPKGTELWYLDLDKNTLSRTSQSGPVMRFGTVESARKRPKWGIHSPARSDSRAGVASFSGLIPAVREPAAALLRQHKTLISIPQCRTDLPPPEYFLRRHIGYITPAGTAADSDTGKTRDDRITRERNPPRMTIRDMKSERVGPPDGYKCCGTHSAAIWMSESG
jgi:hypothetical protein